MQNDLYEQEIEQRIRSFSRYTKGLSKRTEYTLIAKAQSAIIVTRINGQRPTDESTMALEMLLRQHARQILSIAKKYRGQGVDLWDLYSEGQFGLIKAIEKFDSSKGLRLSTYAVWWIRQTISRTVMDHKSTVRIPVHMQELIRKIKLIEKMHARENDGVLPDTRTIATYLKRLGKTRWEKYSLEMLTAHIENIRNSPSFSKTISLDATIGDGTTTVAEGITDSEDCDGFTHTEKKERLNRLKKAFLTLGKKERFVIEKRFLKGLTLEETAQFLLNAQTQKPLTHERVRQIEAKALKKLRAFMASQNQ